MPNNMRFAPDVKKIENIILGHPKTENSELEAFTNIQIAMQIDIKDKTNPKEIANLSGLSENEIIMSSASLILLLMVYEGLPLNLSP